MSFTLLCYIVGVFLLLTAALAATDIIIANAIVLAILGIIAILAGLVLDRRS